MPELSEGDYILGTGDEELDRLGMQHRVWRATTLDLWERAGITSGTRVLDVGSGPGFATVDLAEIVGPTGQVVAVERSPHFIAAARAACRMRGLTNVQVHEIDLMIDAVPTRDMDVAWCRWVALFVSSPETLVARIADALRPGGVAIFYDYVHYTTLQLIPPGPRLKEFVGEVEASWRANDGDPDVARRLPGLLADVGMVVRSAIPRVFCIKPGGYMWQWPARFIDINLDRLVELGRVDPEWADAVRREFAAAETDPRTLLLTPMVLELIAQRVD